MEGKHVIERCDCEESRLLRATLSGLMNAVATLTRNGWGSKEDEALGDAMRRANDLVEALHTPE